VDAILTRMGAYDNMFSNSSTFKVELDEWYMTVSTSKQSILIPYSCKIMRDATPKSFVILDGVLECHLPNAVV
jgi:DNA mismatch repair protein MSH6